MRKRGIVHCREPGRATRFEAILLSDTQPQTDAELDYIRDDVVAELIGSNARFGMTTAFVYLGITTAIMVLRIKRYW